MTIILKAYGNFSPLVLPIIIIRLRGYFINVLIQTVFPITLKRGTFNDTCITIV